MHFRHISDKILPKNLKLYLVFFIISLSNARQHYMIWGDAGSHSYDLAFQDDIAIDQTPNNNITNSKLCMSNSIKCFMLNYIVNSGI